MITKLKVKGMHCKSCEMLIQDTLEEAKGINKVKIHNNTLTVDFDNTIIPESAVKKIIERGGYKVD